MGVDTVTVQNLEIIEVNASENYILVSGNVPGAKNSLVLIRSAVKGGKVTPKEIISYEDKKEETVEPEATETVEEVKEEVVETAEEVKEEVAEETAEAPEAEDKKEEEQA